ncbi:hypothetical protein FRC11_002117 [Ceratobasidium sp. 423]|nr:hypothetical protein FRC11_002117 [Ceratobasidium sp. 423]
MAKVRFLFPSIKMRTTEPVWNCKCKPEVRCRLVVEIPPPKHPHVWWTIRRPTRSNAPSTEVENFTSGGSSSYNAPTRDSAENTATSRTTPQTQTKHQVSMPHIETLPNKVDEDCHGDSDWEPEEDEDELEEDELEEDELEDE